MEGFKLPVMAQWDLPPHKRNSSLIYVGGKQRGDIHNKWVSKELGTKKGQIGKSPISNSKIILLLNLALRLPELGLLVFVSNLQRFMTGESIYSNHSIWPSTLTLSTFM